MMKKKIDEKKLALKYNGEIYGKDTNSRKQLKKSMEIEKKVEKEGDWNKFSEAVVDDFIKQTLALYE